MVLLPTDDFDKEATNKNINSQLIFFNNLSLNNSSEFNASPDGWRHGVNGDFQDINTNANFWTSSESNTQNPDNLSENYTWVRSIKHDESGVSRYTNENKDGFSVRFVKDFSSILWS